MGTVRTAAAPSGKRALPESVHKTCGTELEDLTVQVSDGRLANAVVWVDDAPDEPVPAAGPLLDQKRCRYEPPVLVAHTGAKLKIKNSDPLMHNVRADALFNVGMPIEGQVIERAMPDVPGPMTVVCDVHPWMRADVMVLRHGRWAVTDSQGAFRIEGVPPGPHPLRIWHPTLGDKRVTVDVPAQGEAQVDVTL